MKEEKKHLPPDRKLLMQKVRRWLGGYEDLANVLGVTDKTMWNKLVHKNFKDLEKVLLARELELTREEFCDIFFPGIFTVDGKVIWDKPKRNGRAYARNKIIWTMGTDYITPKGYARGEEEKRKRAEMRKQRKELRAALWEQGLYLDRMSQPKRKYTFSLEQREKARRHMVKIRREKGWVVHNDTPLCLLPGDPGYEEQKENKDE